MGYQLFRRTRMMTFGSLPQQYICKWALLVRLLYSLLDLEAGHMLSVPDCCYWWLLWLLSWWADFSNLFTLFSLFLLVWVEVNFWTFMWTDCHFNRGVRKLELCCNWRDRMGLGWCSLAIQHHLLHPTWFDKVLHSLCLEWTSLGSCYWTKGMNCIDHLMINTFIQQGSF